MRCTQRKRPDCAPRPDAFQVRSINVTEPILQNHPERSTDGLNLAGQNTTIKDLWWSNKFAYYGKDWVFEEFKNEYWTVRVNTEVEQGSAQAALDDFRRWCVRKGILPEFDDFWRAAPPPARSK